MVSPLKAAQLECANYHGSGRCLGMGITPTGGLARFRPPGPCLLTEKGKRCLYLETAVLRMKESVSLKLRARSGQLPVRAMEGWEGMRRGYYRRACNVASEKRRRCRECGARELERRARLCHECRGKRLRAAWRDSKARKRGGVSKVNLENTSDFPGKQGCFLGKTPDPVSP